MKTILTRLVRLEQLEKEYNPDGVVLLMLQPDGTWELCVSGKRSVYQTEEEARRHVLPTQHLIIDDL